jgi:hypothetical protein
MKTMATMSRCHGESSPITADSFPEKTPPLAVRL